jgi:hypothetical protein
MVLELIWNCKCIVWLAVDRTWVITIEFHVLSYIMHKKDDVQKLNSIFHNLLKIIIHKQDLCPSSEDVNRLMMMMNPLLFEFLYHTLNTIQAHIKNWLLNFGLLWYYNRVEIFIFAYFDMSLYFIGDAISFLIVP